MATKAVSQSAVEVRPVIVYPDCHLRRRRQDCRSCGLSLAGKCRSPVGQCVLPYPGHGKGCPNYGKKDDCSPNMPMFDRVFRMDKPVYAIYTVFDLGGHVREMKARHPEWSERQCRCCLYWQGAARKIERRNAESFLNRRGGEGYVATDSPEAMGVDITETMKNAGIVLEWPPRRHVYKIALAGMLLDEAVQAISINGRPKRVTPGGFVVFDREAVCGGVGSVLS